MLAETSLFDVSPEDGEVKAEPVGCPVMQVNESDDVTVQSDPQQACVFIS